ncbi:MAG: AAA family ATPase, partial [Candidatus Peribacteraceae bacterium]|nr:AAA family ATPase [Candidatus Peribacteraceae bacterium]
MVRLEKIVLHGFKSFKRPTAMTFPSNFAVVTGPNGCGKSNIGDSIAFVLGKGSSKHLRAKKAGDLVFHGSAGKNASDYAKVNLLFSNNQKILPMTETDVTVMRRLNKEGVSSYRLNGKMTTRQQMLDIFMQARMNPGGHNIIKQGDVSKIVDMNPIERRAILDEISGIKEYDEKKENALRQLSKVEEKVKEAEIILEQKEEIIDKLKAERDAAMEYQKLNMELELVKSTIIWKEFTVSEKKIGTLDKDIGETEEEVSKIQKEIDKIDVQMNAKDKELDDLMKEVMQQDQVEIMKKISKVESSLESKENMILSNDREISRLGDMIKNLTTFNRQFNPDMKPILDMQGVHGTLKDLVSIPEQYRIAAEVAGGNHMNDIVVENLNIAIQCVRYLKENRIGRARFLPLDKINSIPKRELPDGTLGWLSELMHHERQFSSVVDYVFGRTACVNDIDKAKNIAEKNRIRMVTLDGDIFETSGAVMGGHYRKKTAPETKKYRDTITKLEEESGILRIEIEELETKLGELNKGVERKDGFDYEKKNRAIKEDIENLRP